MSDVSQSAREWWTITLKGVEERYAQWLSSNPLQRLRLDAGASEAAIKWWHGSGISSSADFCRCRLQAGRHAVTWPTGWVQLSPDQMI